jgi:stage II sporulation protein D
VGLLRHHGKAAIAAKNIFFLLIFKEPHTMTHRTQSLPQRLSPVATVTKFVSTGLVAIAQRGRKNLKYCGWLASIAVLSAAAAAPAQANVPIRVAIKREAAQVNIGSSVNAAVRDRSGKVIGEIQGMNGFVAQRDGGNVALDKWKSDVITVEPKDANGVVWIGDRWYRGRVVITTAGSGITAVNWVDIEQYLYSVLGGEMNGSWHQEALKAQAVAARTYALYNQQRSRNGSYDVVDTTSSQVYRGIQDESTGTQMAVNGTKGQVLTYNGNLILAAFHSSSGGKTDNVEEVWTQPLPYLRAVPDFDQEAPVFSWKKTFTAQQMNSWFSCNGGNVQSFRVLEKTTGDRVRTMEVKTSKGSCRFDGEKMQDILDLRSNKFAITAAAPAAAAPTKDGKPAPAKPSGVTEFEVIGGGFGHGLGLSQYGALGMAKRGYNYQTIVSHYYQNTKLSKISVQ